MNELKVKYQIIKQAIQDSYFVECDQERWEEMAVYAADILICTALSVEVCQFVANCTEYKDLLALVAANHPLAIELDSLRLGLGY